MIIFLTTVVIQKKRKLILSTQTITFFSISYYHYTTGELYARRKKSSRSKVNNKIKRKKNPLKLSENHVIRGEDKTRVGVQESCFFSLEGRGMSKNHAAAVLTLFKQRKMITREV